MSSTLTLQFWVKKQQSLFLQIWWFLAGILLWYVRAPFRRIMEYFQFIIYSSYIRLRFEFLFCVHSLLFILFFVFFVLLFFFSSNPFCTVVAILKGRSQNCWEKKRIMLQSRKYEHLQHQLEYSRSMIGTMWSQAGVFSFNSMVHSSPPSTSTSTSAYSYSIHVQIEEIRIKSLC